MHTKKKIRWFYAGWTFVWGAIGISITFFPLGADMSKANAGVPLWIFRFSQAMLLLGFGVFAFLSEKNKQAKAAPKTDKDKTPASE